MSGAVPLTVYDLFIWRRLASVARDWRVNPTQARAIDVQKVGQLAGKAAIPYPDEDQRRAQIYGAVRIARDFAWATLQARQATWPEFAAALPVIDALIGERPTLAPSPPASRLADDGLSPAKLPYWVE